MEHTISFSLQYKRGQNLIDAECYQIRVRKVVLSKIIKQLGKNNAATIFEFIPCDYHLEK